MVDKFAVKHFEIVGNPGESLEFDAKSAQDLVITVGSLTGLNPDLLGNLNYNCDNVSRTYHFAIPYGANEKKYREELNALDGDIIEARKRGLLVQSVEQGYVFKGEDIEIGIAPYGMFNHNVLGWVNLVEGHPINVEVGAMQTYLAGGICLARRLPKEKKYFLN